MSGQILMIDDDKEMVTLGKLILEREGYTFHSAYDGPEGLSLLKEKKDIIELVLLDIMLPKANGLAVAGVVPTCAVQTSWVPMSADTGGSGAGSGLGLDEQADTSSATTAAAPIRQAKRWAAALTCWPPWRPLRHSRPRPVRRV